MSADDSPIGAAIHTANSMSIEPTYCAAHRATDCAADVFAISSADTGSNSPAQWAAECRAFRTANNATNFKAICAAYCAA